MSETPVPLVRARSVVLALGFRPFFLSAGILAVVALPLWLALLRGLLPGDPYYGGTTWHAHAMLFGYGTAVIAGFLLTASRNWTGMATASGAELAALAGLWLAGQIAPWLPMPGPLIAVVDLAFPLVLALSLVKPLWFGPNPVNRVFLGLLLAMGGASLLVHLQALRITQGTALMGDKLMLDLILVTLLIVSGRIMPFFTRSAISGSDPQVRPWVEGLTFAVAGLWLLSDVASHASPLTGVLALALAAIQALRLSGWHHPRVWGDPLLWVLYSGYLWLILGLALNGLAHLGLTAPFPALHALTVGTFGVFTLGMMSRVTLGHTGRALRAPPAMVAAFGLLNLAALVRVFAPLLWPTRYGDWLLLSGLFWTLAFGAFLWIHGPMLIAPRADGRPG
ncbi:MAG: NnrS family protein [Bdellovibrio bacteriovorus]